MFEELKLDICEDTVHVHVVEISSGLTSESKENFLQYLTKQEIEKWQRFRFKKDRDIYLTARALVRTQLSKYLDGRSPISWEFTTNKYGKPFMASNASVSSFYFNVSHTNGYVICVFGLHQNIGVDIEYVNPDIDIENLAPQYFAPQEVQELFKMPNERRLERFYEYWSLKEAYIKAIGLGLSMPLDEFCIEFYEDDSVEIRIDNCNRFSKSNWALKKLPGFKNCKAAFCMERATSKDTTIDILKHEIQ